MNFEYTASPSNFDIDNQTFMIPYTPPPHLFSRLDILIIFGRTFWYPPPPHIPPHHIQSRRYVPALLVANSYMNMYIVLISLQEEKKTNILSREDTHSLIQSITVFCTLLIPLNDLLGHKCPRTSNPINIEVIK